MQFQADSATNVGVQPLPFSPLLMGGGGDVLPPAATEPFLRQAAPEEHQSGKRRSGSESSYSSSSHGGHGTSHTSSSPTDDPHHDIDDEHGRTPYANVPQQPAHVPQGSFPYNHQPMLDPRFVLPGAHQFGTPLGTPTEQFPRGANGTAQFGATQMYPFHAMHHQQQLPPPLGGAQFGGAGTLVPGMEGATSGIFGTRGTAATAGLRPGFRYIMEGAGPPHHHLAAAAAAAADESLPTFPNAAAAPSRLPAHKPVRLSQPKHPLAPPGTPVYFKYGEEHYPEETVPPEYTFTEADGTVCRYITNFLVYNKRGERLLPVEVLDQPRHAALVLYGSLLPAAAMAAQGIAGQRRSSTTEEGYDQNDKGGPDGRGKRQRPGTSAAVALPSKRHVGLSRDTTRQNRRRSSSEGGGSYGVMTQTYPVRVELAEWCIDYGQEPSNVPFIWLISRWDVYYRLEKPAGRYISTFATAKMKFEVSTRIIKTLQHRPDTPYKTIVDLLSAASRLEKLHRKAERRRRRNQLGISAKSEINDGGGADTTAAALTVKPPSPTELKTEEITPAGPPSILYDTKGGGVQPTTKKKNRNWRVQSLSTPQGTGVAVLDETGRPHALTPWGSPYAVEGFRESMLLGLAEFLESQLRNFMEGVGGEASGCPNLLNTPFMRTLRERTALRMEAIQLMEAKRRALEVAKSLAEAAAASGGGSLGDVYSPYGPPIANGYRPPGGYYQQASSYYGEGTAGVGTPSGPTMMSAGTSIAALEQEIQHLQRLLKDSDDESDNSDCGSSDSDTCGGHSSSYSDDDEADGGGTSNLLPPGDTNHHHHHHGGGGGPPGNTGSGGGGIYLQGPPGSSGGGITAVAAPTTSFRTVLGHSDVIEWHGYPVRRHHKPMPSVTAGQIDKTKSPDLHNPSLHTLFVRCPTLPSDCRPTPLLLSQPVGTSATASTPAC